MPNLIETIKNVLSPRTAIHNAVQNAGSGIISCLDAVGTITTAQVEALLYSQLSRRIEEIPECIIAKGINASPGAATGQIFLDLKRARKHHEENDTPIILVCLDLKPEDIDSVIFSKGWLISHSGATSHVYVVARQKNIPCVTGIKSLRIHETQRTVTIGDCEFSEGDWITIDGSTGMVISGQLNILLPDFASEVHLHKLLEWADDIRTLVVHANADTPKDAEQAK
jgi:pyruvate,orthophosphate dikinase